MKRHALHRRFLDPWMRLHPFLDRRCHNMMKRSTRLQVDEFDHFLPVEMAYAVHGYLLDFEQLQEPRSGLLYAHDDDPPEQSHADDHPAPPHENDPLGDGPGPLGFCLPAHSFPHARALPLILSWPG